MGEEYQGSLQRRGDGKAEEVSDESDLKMMMLSKEGHSSRGNSVNGAIKQVVPMGIRKFHIAIPEYNVIGSFG